MDHGAWKQLLSDMIAASGVRCVPARTPWPMHRAVRLLYEDAGRTGNLGLLPPAPTFSPCPETGLSAAGADSAFRGLIRDGLLREVGVGTGATVIVDPAELVEIRRSLMMRDPRAAAMLQRAGERWAAFASTAAKTAAIAVEPSSALTVASATA